MAGFGPGRRWPKPISTFQRKVWPGQEVGPSKPGKPKGKMSPCSCLEAANVRADASMTSVPRLNFFFKTQCGACPNRKKKKI